MPLWMQCIAGGSPPPRLNWTKDDSPLVVTERHFFAAGNQLLIIVDSDISDAGKYTCEMSNTLGTERGHVRLSVIPTPTCDSPQMTASSLDDDGWATVGIVIIAVVCCVVGTSLVWVVIIYHTRRRNEDCSITNTGVSTEAWHGAQEACVCLWSRRDLLLSPWTEEPGGLHSTGSDAKCWTQLSD